jgi:hypothetical protein
MESGLECEYDVEGTMDEMALREERDGVGKSGKSGARAARNFFSPPTYYFCPASGQPNNNLRLPPSFFLLCFVIFLPLIC